MLFPKIFSTNSRHNEWLRLSLCSLFSVLCFLNSSAQLNFDFTEGKFLLKGRVTDLKSHAGVPNANVLIVNTKRGLSTDIDGYFTTYVHLGDTLKFSSLGYIPKIIPVSIIDEREKYTLDVQLVEDIYKLKTVAVYRFRTKNEFEQAFIKAEGVPENIVVPGIDKPKYFHKEKAKFTNPISMIYEKIKAKRRAANPDFRP